MSRIFLDQRSDATQPQTHALVIGVGDYPHLRGGRLFASSPALTTLGLGQLTSSVVSAKTFANWLIANYNNGNAPLGSVELLVSPGGNHLTPSNAIEQVESATMDNIKKAFDRWYERCAKTAKNIAIFYYCGHGLEREAMLLLPEDFGASENRLWENCINFNSTYWGMGECPAETQCYFLDACRETPIDLLKFRTVDAQTLKDTQQTSFPLRDAPVLKAAPVGQKAYGPPNDVSFFTAALIRSFEGFGARRLVGSSWRVTTDSLLGATIQLMNRTRLPNGPRLTCSRTGDSNFETEIHEFSNPAHVIVHITCEPLAALSAADLYMNNGRNPPLRRAPGPEPWEIEVEAGTYIIGADFPNGQFRSTSLLGQIVFPPYFPCSLEV
jgi:hypothetical protein